MNRRIAVIGGGLIGATTAVALERTFGNEVVHIAPDAKGDERTTALLMDSIDLLRELDAWDSVEAHAAPLRIMRLLDGSKRLIRPRPIDFQSTEIGLRQFGFNVRNDAIVAELAKGSECERVRTAVEGMRRSAQGWTLELTDGSDIRAEAVVAADGRDSIAREAVGLPVRRWSYPQVALVTTFAHERPHRGVSAEFHTETGPFTQVPLPPEGDTPDRSSLVWVVRPEEVGGLQALSKPRLEALLAEKMAWMFGSISLERDLAGYPLSGLIAERFGGEGVFLVGEAGHVFPPIGAQGANLGFRDIRACREALATNADSVRASERYARQRSADVAGRTAAVDALNRSILSGFLPLQLARTLGTGLLARSDGLRRRIMRAGLAPSS